MPLLMSTSIMDDEDAEEQQQQPRQIPVGWHRFHISKSKLKNSSRTSALLAGFAMVALVEFDLTMPGQVSVAVHPGILIAFGVCTTLLVSVHLLALMMSVCALPHMDAVNGPSDIRASLHHQLHGSVEIAWLFSTVLGLLLFLAEVGLICWIKFAAIQLAVASYATTAVLVPVLIIFLLFTRRFYQVLYKHKRNLVDQSMNDLYKSYECLNKSSAFGNATTILSQVDEVKRSYLNLQDAISANLMAVNQQKIETLRRVPTLTRIVSPSPTVFIDGRGTPVPV